MVKKNKGKTCTIKQWLIIGIGFLILDQIIKALIVAKKEFFSSKIISMHLLINTGTSFSILTGLNKILIWISLIVIGLFIFYFDKIEEKYSGLAILAILGATSNLLDRIFRAGVVDYFDFHWWPVFNIADSMIVIGVLACIIIMIREELKDKKKNAQK